MMPGIYFNEFEQSAAAWLRELGNANAIPAGEIDQRSIKDVLPDDVRRFTQCHFFAGIGGWSYALRLAGWPEDRPVWTGSCPCQPYSAAGKQKGNADERNLWPDFFRLIRECRPDTVFGEQVASGLVLGGSNRKQKDVQSLQYREELFRVFRELQREQASDLQRMLTGKGANSKTLEQIESISQLQGMASAKSRSCTCERSQASCEKTRDGIQPGNGKHPKQNRQRNLRSERDSIRPLFTEIVGRPITGQDRFEQGVYDGQCESDFICNQCGGEQLGSWEGYASCFEYSETAEVKISEFDEWNREQVEGAIRHGWLDGIQADLEREGYAVGHCVLGAHSVRAPHIRQRLYWVANSGSTASKRNTGRFSQTKAREHCHRQFDGSQSFGPNHGGPTCGMADDQSERRTGMVSERETNIGQRSRARSDCTVGRLADPDGGITGNRGIQRGGQHGLQPESGEPHGMEHPTGDRRDERRAEPEGYAGYVGNGNEPGWDDADSERSTSQAGRVGFWDDAILIPCRDGKSRRIKPGLEPLVDGISGRVALLRGAGNAIVPQTAAAFIRAFLETEGG